MESPKITKANITTPKYRHRNTSGSSKNSDTSANRRQSDSSLIIVKKRDIWAKADGILNHLALSGFKDNRPPMLQKIIRSQLLASRKALQLRADPLVVAKPLMELADIVEEQGLETGNIMSKQLQVIFTCLSQAKNENFEDRAAELARSYRLRDPKGLQMKKLLQEAKTLLGRMTDLNELQINLTNSVESILKNSGYLRENESLTSHKRDIGSKKSDSKNPPMITSYNWKKIEGVLDHLMRVCLRPNIAPDLQQTLLSKIATARISLNKKEDPLKISKYLHEMIDIINSHGLHSGEAMHSRLEGMNNPSDYYYTKEAEDCTSIVSTMTGLELRKILDQTKICIRYLSDLNELKMIFRNSADLILRSCPLQRLPWMEKNVDIEELFRSVDKTALPASLKTAIRMILSEARTLMSSTGGQEALAGPLEVMSRALKEQAPDFATRACNNLLVAIASRNERTQPIFTIK